MVSRTRFRAFLTGLALYALAALAILYFGHHAYTGKYGLNAREALDQEAAALGVQIQSLKAERALWSQRVALLRADSLDPDMVDERARAQLNYAHPRDLVKRLPSR